jgi:hypothetical protein
MIKDQILPNKAQDLIFKIFNYFQMHRIVGLWTVLPIHKNSLQKSGAVKNESELQMETFYKYYVSGHYPSSCFYLKHRHGYIWKHNVSETGFCLRLQVKPTQLGPTDTASH